MAGCRRSVQERVQLLILLYRVQKRIDKKIHRKARGSEESDSIEITRPFVADRNLMPICALIEYESKSPQN